MRRILFAALAGTVLTSCGGPGEGSFQTEDSQRVEYDVDAAGGDTEYRITGEDGEEMVISSGTDVVAELPDGFAIYPGAKVVSSTSVNRGEGKGAMVTMQSDDSPAEMVRYYRRQAEAAGIDIAMEMTSSGSSLIGGEGQNGETFSFNASPTEGGAIGQLVVAGDLQQ